MFDSTINSPPIFFDGNIFVIFDTIKHEQEKVKLLTRE